MRRYLRIAFSVGFCIVCLLFVALWVRSYSWLDRVDWPLGRFHEGWTAATVSMDGLVLVGVQPEQYNRYAANSYAYRLGYVELEKYHRKGLDRGLLGFKIIRGPKEWGLQLPWPAVIAIMGFCAAIPWIKLARRFSLRMLLVVMTLIAAVLGLSAMGN